jgi:tRNA-splicing ligase RtcB
VGYDINCLAYGSLIVHELGYHRPIGAMADAWRSAELACYNLGEARRAAAGVVRWFGQRPREPVLRVVTEAGDEVLATADHPFWTPDGMRPLADLGPGDQVGYAPFQGVPYEAPSEAVILDEDDFAAKWAQLRKPVGGNGLAQAVGLLRERGLLPLRYSSPALPYLCKVLGFVFGDGNLHFAGENEKGVVSFYGGAGDLEAIRADLLRIGMVPSRIYFRQRSHSIRTPYGVSAFERREEWFKVVGSGFAVLLACLGAPVGNKAERDYSLPAWLDGAPAWHRRLFLAALFGAELTSPATVTGHPTVFFAPTLGMNKRPAFCPGGKRFLENIAAWLRPFGVETQAILVEDAIETPAGRPSQRLRLVLSSRAESLLNLWSAVGYEYNRARSHKAALAVQYLKHKAAHLAARTATAREAVALAGQGVPRGQIMERFVGPQINQRFIERALYCGRPFTPRVAEHFPSFADFCAVRGDLPGGDGMVWERIARIEPADDYTGDVYDFTVDHPDHNFIANGFVVSNCGVRLVRSNLSFKEVKPHLRTLVEELFREVPTGVGKKGKYHFNDKELKQLMAEGPRYVVRRGLGTARDIDFTEAHGRLDGADPDMVSDRALARGAQQCGTLGSGNHFLEVQIVDEIFDADAAAVMGLEKDQVCVMIHSGSRGLGYQVCDDALAMLRKAPEKYGIALPDRQLACAPVNSPEGQRYLAAMRAAADFAWCNRQLLMQQAREVFATVFGQSWQELQMNLIYDVCHNIAKLEEHTVGGRRKRVWVHRKGATRAFPPDHPEIPAAYRKIGQPVIIPGDMGRASWVLVGQPGSMERTFGTTCHGAGRAMSRTAAVKEAGGRRIDKELEARGVIARAQSRRGLAEEQPKAYKNVDEVVEVVHRAGLSKKVARMRPIGVIKG